MKIATKVIGNSVPPLLAQKVVESFGLFPQKSGVANPSFTPA